MVITDHRNLGYFKQPQNLSHWQARWWLFLQEYNIRWGVERGINMGPADALSRKDKIETSNDNWEITLLKGKDQYFHIHTIDSALAKKISSSSEDNPIITKAITGLPDSHGYDSVMVVVDHGLTKGVIYCPCTKILMLQESPNSFSLMFSLNLASIPR